MKKNTKTPRPDVAKIVTDKIIAALEAGTIPWQKTWRTVDQFPTSLSTGKRYRGINVFLLTLQAQVSGYSSPWWGTYRQISERGGQVRKGEEGTEVVFWKFLDKVEVVDGEKIAKKIPFLRYYHVFNSEQCDWAEGSKAPATPTPAHSDDPLADAEALVAEYLHHGPSLSHGGDRAFYSPLQDEVRVPHFEAFGSAAAYYSTLYHELTHSTGHVKRLAREGIADGTFGKFGDAVYSQEELVAEMGAAMLCAIAGIDQDAVFGSSASYIASWLKVLKGDNKLVIRAAAQAQKAADLITGNVATNGNEEAEAA